MQVDRGYFRQMRNGREKWPWTHRWLRTFRDFELLAGVLRPRLVSGKGLVDDSQRSDCGRGGLVAELEVDGWRDHLC
jgi:hypothetical protein